MYTPKYKTGDRIIMGAGGLVVFEVVSWDSFPEPYGQYYLHALSGTDSTISQWDAQDVDTNWRPATPSETPAEFVSVIPPESVPTQPDLVPAKLSFGSIGIVIIVLLILWGLSRR
jgi:hypothetical protein